MNDEYFPSPFPPFPSFPLLSPPFPSFSFLLLQKKKLKCAEALGAIGKEDYLNILEEFCRDDAPEVSETCQIAVDRIKWKKEEVKYVLLSLNFF